MHQHLVTRHRAVVGLALAVLTLTACNKPQTAPKPPEAPSAPVAPVPPPPPAVVMPAGFSVTSPMAGAATTSPLTVTGVAPNDWYFEAVFEAVLLDAEGNVLVEAPAQTQSDWTKPGPTPFKAVFAYSVDTTQTGTVVLTEDQTGKGEDGDNTPVREVRIPVMLTAGN
jgi:hypothetical protein